MELMAKRVALITGVTGQDGAYLAEFLLNKGYVVHGLKRRSSSFNTGRVDHLYQDPHEQELGFTMHYGDMTDATNLIRVVQETQPDEIYNLAAQSHVQVSFETPEYTANADGLGTLRLLEAIRILNMEQRVRFYQASTSKLYGKVQQIPQSEAYRDYVEGMWLITQQADSEEAHRARTHSRGDRRSRRTRRRDLRNTIRMKAAEIVQGTLTN